MFMEPHYAILAHLNFAGADLGFARCSSGVGRSTSREISE
jgi:hypothetical protein